MILLLVGLVGALTYVILPRNHWVQTLGTLEEAANMTAMFASLISATAALLLTGVIVMAPLLRCLSTRATISYSNCMRNFKIPENKRRPMIWITSQRTCSIAFSDALVTVARAG